MENAHTLSCCTLRTQDIHWGCDCRRGRGVRGPCRWCATCSVSGCLYLTGGQRRHALQRRSHSHASSASSPGTLSLSTTVKLSELLSCGFTPACKCTIQEYYRANLLTCVQIYIASWRSYYRAARCQQSGAAAPRTFTPLPLSAHPLLPRFLVPIQITAMRLPLRYDLKSAVLCTCFVCDRKFVTCRTKEWHDGDMALWSSPRYFQEVEKQKGQVDEAARAVVEANEELLKVQEASADAKKSLTQARQKAARARSKAQSTQRALNEKNAACITHDENFKVSAHEW